MITFTTIVATLAATSSAADKPVEDLLSQMRSAYKAIHSATFTSESHFGDTVFVNDYTYASPSKIRLEISSPKGSSFQEKLIKASDGETIRFKLPNSNSFTQAKFTLDAFENNLPANLESYCFFDSERQLSTAPGKNMEKSLLHLRTNQMWNGKGWTLLEETAKAQGVLCSYYVDPKTHLIWRVVVRQIAKPETVAAEFFLKKLNASAKIDPSAFRPAIR